MAGASDDLFVLLSFDIGQSSNLKGIEKLGANVISACVTEGLEGASKTLRSTIKRNMRNHPTANLEKMTSAVTYRMLSKDTALVSVDDPQAAFYEFGTGIVGKSSGIQNQFASEVGWVHDSKSHGTKGWYAPSDRFDPQSYKKLVSKEKGIYHTMGMPAHNFFYNGVESIRRYDTVIKAIRKAMRNRLK